MKNIIGIDELIADLKQVDKVQASTLRKLVNQAAKPVLAEAKSNAPFATGKLKKSLALKFEKSKQGKKVVRIVSRDGVADTKYQNRDVPYIFFVEGGRKKGNRGTTPARPFTKIALKDNYQSILDNLQKPLLEAFDTVMRGK